MGPHRVAGTVGILLLAAALALVSFLPADGVVASNLVRMPVQQRQMLMHEHLHYGLPNRLFIPSGDEEAQTMYGGGGWYGGFDPSYTVLPEHEDSSPYIRPNPTRGYDADTLAAMRMLGKTGADGVPFDYNGPQVHQISKK